MKLCRKFTVYPTELPGLWLRPVFSKDNKLELKELNDKFFFPCQD